MEEKKKFEAVSVEFYEEQLARQRKSITSCISIYARSISDIASHIAYQIINAQVEQLLTDDEISEKVDTRVWTERDYDHYRTSSATVRLKYINENMQFLLDGIINLLEVIKREGGEKNEEDPHTI